MKSILLIPGVLSDETLWVDLPAKLADKFQVHYADIPNQTNIPAMAKEVLNNAPEKFWVISFSLGGWIALELMKLKPEAIEGLILISTSDGQLFPQTRQAMQHAIEEMQKGNFAQYVTDCLALYLTPEHAQDPILTSHMRKMMNRVGPKMAITQYQAILKMDKAFDSLDKISCPTLIIRGSNDMRYTLEMHHSLCNKISHAQSTLIEDTAHFVSLEQPKALANAIEMFIKNHLK